MRSVSVRVGLALVATGLAMCGFRPAFMASVARAAGVCRPIASPSHDISPSGGLTTGADVIATFDHARQAEGCRVALSIDAAAYDRASLQRKMLMLFNAERRDRGLPPLRLDRTLLSRIDLNHSREMAQYNYFGHPSPINHPGVSPLHIFGRLLSNPDIAGRQSAMAENIAGGFTPAGAVYAYMYSDSAEEWGHRHNVLGYVRNRFGAFNWVGVGIARGGWTGVYYSSDFLQSSTYVPPAVANTRGPVFHAPTIIAGKAGGTVTARVTGVSDRGRVTGEAGVTGVVFSGGPPRQDGLGKANTVTGTQVAPGTWVATLSLPAGTALHAVAVDGSGNYTDCVAGKGICSPSSGQ